MPVVFLAAPKAPLRRTVSLGLVQESLGLVQEGSKKDTNGSDLENVISRSREIGTMGLKRKRSSLPRQLSSYFGFEEEDEEDVGEASIWYKPSPHPSVSKWPLITSFQSAWSAFHSLIPDAWLRQRIKNSYDCPSRASPSVANRHVSIILAKN